MTAYGIPRGSTQAGLTAGSTTKALELQELHHMTERIVNAIGQVIEGKKQIINIALAVLLSEGHLLIEDIPGVGKTTLAKALARSVDCSTQRIQFTPDLLPSDVTGTTIYHQSTHNFEFKPGPIFANIIIGDEINRASPKTQSALLECMEERQVTVDGVTHPLEPPFMVIATQNPAETDGTYPLPEAQRDRFAAQIAMGYPDQGAELAVLDHHGELDPLESLTPVINVTELCEAIITVRHIYVSNEIKQYIINLVTATRHRRELRLGASPRASLRLMRTARAIAALQGRHFVTPDDIQMLAIPVLAHRLVLTPEARIARERPETIVSTLIAQVPIPRTNFDLRDY